MVVLPNTQKKSASEVAERLRLTIESIDCSKISPDCKVTVSIGVVEVDLSFNVLEDVIKAADTALYAAKEAGRNCIRLA